MIKFKAPKGKSSELAFFMRLKNMMQEHLIIEESDSLLSLVNTNNGCILSIGLHEGVAYYFYSDNDFIYSLSRKEFSEKLYDFR